MHQKQPSPIHPHPIPILIWQSKLDPGRKEEEVFIESAVYVNFELCLLLNLKVLTKPQIRCALIQWRSTVSALDKQTFGQINSSTINKY